MALMRCRGCSTLYAIGLLRCPQCQAISEVYGVPDHVEVDAVAKSTVTSGASNETPETVSLVEETPDEPAVGEPTVEDQGQSVDDQVGEEAPDTSASVPSPSKGRKKSASS